MSENSIAFTGRGGQGIVFSSEILAKTLFKQGYYVAQLSSYGAEVRGGSVLSYVVYSYEPIENPFIEKFDIVIVLHEVGIKRWLKLIEASKLIIADKDTVKTTLGNMIKLPIIKECEKNNVVGRENVVAIGLLAGLEVINENIVKEVLREEKDYENNLKALNVGIEIARELKLPYRLR